MRLTTLRIEIEDDDKEENYDVEMKKRMTLILKKGDDVNIDEEIDVDIDEEEVDVDIEEKDVDIDEQDCVELDGGR